MARFGPGVGAALLVMAAACAAGSDGASERPTAPDPSIPVPSVTVDLTGDTATLRWDPVDSAQAYRVGNGETATDVPAAVCDTRCALTVSAGTEWLTSAVSVSTVMEGGGYSEPDTVTVDLPEPAPGNGDDPAGGGLEVLLVHGWDPDDEGSRPEVETVPVASMQEAERLIEASQQADTGIVSASLNPPVTLADASRDADGAGHAEATWQTDAMQFDLLPEDRRGGGIVVGLIEMGGVDPDHPSLRGAVDRGTTIGDPTAAGVIEDGARMTDDDAHATATSSLIVGQPGGAVPGVAPSATILPVDIGGDPTVADMAEGIMWAVDNGADVINISLAATCATADPASCTSGLRSAVDYAEAHEVVVVASADNNGSGEGCKDPPNAASMPAVLDTVISVGAYGPDSERWECSPERFDVDLLAPGIQLLTAEPAGAYGVRTGTSYSAPLVAGLIATILAERPDLTPADIRAMLPQWRLPDGRLSVGAALVVAGIADVGDEAFDDVVGVYPYEVGLGFDASHPVSDLVRAVDETAANGTTDMHWDGPLLADRGTDESAFGVITGLVLIHDDGSVTASGWWAIDRLDDWSVSSTVYGRHGPFAGHTVYCEPTPVGTLPATRSVRWDVPVAVEATPVSGTGDDGEPPEVELTFVLGAGGAPPQETVVYDTWDGCAGQIDAWYQQVNVGYDGEMPWSEYGPAVETYFDDLGNLYEALVSTSPLQLDEPVALDDDRVTAHSADDPRVRITFAAPG